MWTGAVAGSRASRRADGTGRSSGRLRGPGGSPRLTTVSTTGAPSAARSRVTAISTACPSPPPGSEPISSGRGTTVPGRQASARSTAIGPGAQFDHPAVEQRRVAAHLQRVRADLQHRVALGQPGDDLAGQRTQPGPLRLVGRDAGGLERSGGHRADGDRQHPVLHRRDELLPLAELVGDGEQAGRRGRAGEGHGVDAAGHDRGDQPPHRGRRPRAAPSGRPARSPPRRRRPAAPATRSGSGSPCSWTAIRRPSQRALRAGEQVGEHLRRGLRLRRPGVDQAAAADRAPRLGAAGHAPAPGCRCSTSGRSQASAASSQPRNPTPVVAITRSTGRAMHLAGGRDQLGVVGQRHDPDGRGVDDPGAAAVQQGAELLLAAGGGDRDRVAGQRLEVGPPVRSRSRPHGEASVFRSCVLPMRRFARPAQSSSDEPVVRARRGAVHPEVGPGAGVLGGELARPPVSCQRAPVRGQVVAVAGQAAGQPQRRRAPPPRSAASSTGPAPGGCCRSPRRPAPGRPATATGSAAKRPAAQS